MSESEKQWEKAGQITLVILLVAMALRIGVYIGAARETKYVEEASESLHEVLDTLNSTDMYGGETPFDDVVDTVTDGIYDALAWLEKTK